MSESNDIDQEQKFAQWLEGKTSQPNHQTKDEDFADEKLWHQRMLAANRLAHHVDVTPEYDVPNWDRSAAFESDKKPWWQWSALPAMSLAFSCFAIALVLLKVELVIKPEGVMLSFADSHQASQDERVAQLVDQKLQAFASEQQVVLANYASDVTVKQQESNLQLASYIMGASRQERKEDINDFIQYINAERADEQFDQKMKFKQLEQAIRFQNTKFERNSYKNLPKNSENLGLQSQPVDWTTEE